MLGTLRSLGAGSRLNCCRTFRKESVGFRLGVWVTLLKGFVRARPERRLSARGAGSKGSVRGHSPPKVRLAEGPPGRF